MAQKEKISIVVTQRILDEEIAELTDKCLQSVIKNTYNPFELIIVDSGSPLIAITNYADLFLRTSKNIGNPLAWDKGIALSSNEKIILMDNDVVVEKDWDKEMIERLADKKIGVTFPYSIVGDELEKKGAGLYVNYRGRRDGFCFAFRKETYDKVGPFLQDQPFKLGYYEDDNFNMEVMKSGAKLVACSESRVWHKGQATSSKMWDEVKDGIEQNKEWYKKKWNNEFPHLEKEA